jgi:hypothetical protein
MLSLWEEMSLWLGAGVLTARLCCLYEPYTKTIFEEELGRGNRFVSSKGFSGRYQHRRWRSRLQPLMPLPPTVHTKSDGFPKGRCYIRLMLVPLPFHHAGESATVQECLSTPYCVERQVLELSCPPALPTSSATYQYPDIQTVADNPKVPKLIRVFWM